MAKGNRWGQFFMKGFFVFISLLFIYAHSLAFELKNVKLNLNIRLRNEFWNTFQPEGAFDNPYDFVLLRARTKIDIPFRQINIYGVLQGVQASFLPDRATGGLGKLYFDASGGKTSPASFNFAEIGISGKISDFSFNIGRIGLRDGADFLYDDKKFNFLKDWRITERLVGNWDWVNVGRRYEGGWLGYGGRNFFVSAFGARVLAGGINFANMFEPLKTVAVFGGALTLKKDALKNTEIRLFEISYYDDRRDVVKEGKNIFIHSPGLSLITVQKLGPGELDFVLWGTYQLGGFRELKQNAFALIGEVGYQFETVFKPWVRAGIAYASGDDNLNDDTRKTFFNITPTNHKWYGYADQIALSNIQNIYAQLKLSYSIFDLLIDLHTFSLASDKDSRWAGSGPFNNSLLGYAEVLKADVVSKIGKDVGSEIDLTLLAKLSGMFELLGGYSRFIGGDLIKKTNPKRSDLDWFYLQLTANF